MFPNITPHCKQEKFIFINITVKTLWSRIAPLAYAHVQREHAIFTHLWAFSKSKFYIKSDRVNLVAPASHIECLFYLPGDTVQTGTGKVDPTRKFKCTTTARGLICLETNKANEQNEITKKSEITKTTVSSEQMDRY